MQKHAFFDIDVHTDEELESLLAIRIEGREQIHMWPLSSIELVTDVEGNRYVYKTQREPTVEPEFYDRATSPLLVDCRVLTRDAGGATMWFDFCELPCLGRQSIGPDEWIAYGRAIVDAIGDIRGDLPHYVDVGSRERWVDFVDATLELTAALQGDGRFTSSSASDLSLLEEWAKSPEVLSVIDKTSRVVQGDCRADHVFVDDGGYRILDWQRPYVCPADVDLVTFLEDRGIDPAPHVDPSVRGVRWFLHLHWAAEAKANLLPELDLFDEWSGQAIGEIRSLSET